MRKYYDAHGVRVVGRNAVGEFEVKHGTPPSTYYTDDLNDALETAKYIATTQQEPRK